MIDADELKNRYRETTQEMDARGRTIVLGRLKLSQQSRVFEMIDKPVNRVMYSVAASIRQIIDAEGKAMLFSFPADAAEVLLRLDLLDQEGFQAASKAYRKINGIPEDEAEEAGSEGLDAALA